MMGRETECLGHRGGRKPYIFYSLPFVYLNNFVLRVCIMCMHRQLGLCLQKCGEEQHSGGTSDRDPWDSRKWQKSSPCRGLKVCAPTPEPLKYTCVT